MWNTNGKSKIRWISSFSGFKDFIRNVREKGGIWASEDVYFAQFRDGFSASYRPEFPERSAEDCAINYSWIKDEWTYVTPEMYDAEYNRVVHTNVQEDKANV